MSFYKEDYWNCQCQMAYWFAISICQKQP